MAQLIKPPTPEEIRKARERSKLLTQLFRANSRIRLRDLLPKIQEIYECSREPAYRKLRGLVESNDCLEWERESPRKLYVVVITPGPPPPPPKPGETGYPVEDEDYYY